MKQIAIENIQFIIVVLTGLFLFFAPMYVRWRRSRQPVELTDTPILLSHYTDQMNILVAQTGTIADMKYQAFITMPPRDVVGTPLSTSALLYRVELPFKTNVHLVGVPKDAGADMLDPTIGDSIMEHVELEGRYSQYFALFCERHMQTNARYILDPSAMLFTVEFCRSHSWEVTDDELYFVQKFSGGSAQDPTFMYDDLKAFVDAIRPAHPEPAVHPDLPVTAWNKKDLPKKSYRNSNPEAAKRRIPTQTYNCPICAAPMIPHEAYFSCPSLHGSLLQGFELPRVRSGKLVPNTSDAPATTHGTLQCPVCDHQMERVDYANSKTIIDSCTNCPYRWLDGGELARHIPAPAS